MNSVICKKCGWVHFQVSKQYVKDWEAEWLRYFNEWEAEKLEMFGITDKPPSTDKYTHCFSCGGSYKNMRDCTAEDFKKLDSGHTIQPILDRNEDL